MINIDELAPTRPARLRDIHEELELFEMLVMDHGGAQGGERGYNELDDVITQLADGTPLSTLWREYRAAIAILNRDRTRLINSLTFRVTNPIEPIQAPASVEDFEEASEFGVPKGIRVAHTRQWMGYPFKWYDLAIRYTFMFLLEADRAQVDALAASALEASNRLTYSRIMRRLFSAANEVANIDDQPYNVYAFYNADGTVPPSFESTAFDGTHTHFLVSGAAAIDSGDLDDIDEHLYHHGYRMTLGYQLVVLVNRQEGQVIRTFRVATGAKYDFIPSEDVGGGVILPENGRIVGRPSLGSKFPGVIGTYGPLVVVEEGQIPAGWVVGLASGGPNNLGNPIGIREHTQASMRGLRLVKGPDRDYPLVDSYYLQGLGAGIRHRGAGVVMKIAAAGGYTAPPAYA